MPGAIWPTKWTRMCLRSRCNSRVYLSCSFVVPKLEDLLFCKFFHHLVPGDTSQSFQAHIVSTTCEMQATNLVFRDDVFVINEIDAPFALKGGIVKNLRIELPIVGAALLNRARIKVQSRPRSCRPVFHTCSGQNIRTASRSSTGRPNSHC